MFVLKWFPTSNIILIFLSVDSSLQAGSTRTSRSGTCTPRALYSQYYYAFTIIYAAADSNYTRDIDVHGRAHDLSVNSLETCD